jgi:hypothetical protein
LNGLTVAMALPLFLTYWIKHTSLPSGEFAIFYTWALVSVIAVPVLIVAEFAVVAVLNFRRPGSYRLGGHILATSIALAAEVVFLIARLF